MPEPAAAVETAVVAGPGAVPTLAAPQGLMGSSVVGAVSEIYKCDKLNVIASELRSDEFYISKHGVSDSNLFNDAHYKIAISQTYFAFTSLSTVGFGDFHPRSDYERIFASFILISGVSMFSYIMSKFIEMMS